VIFFRKRYERAEKEFVAAKMLLAEKSEVKEALTEHLYAVIQQNEQRKAARLATLMKELGLEKVGEGESEAAALCTPIPPLLSFSSINTLHRPAPPTPPSSNPTSPISDQAQHSVGGGGNSPSTPSTEQSIDSSAQLPGADDDIKTITANNEGDRSGTANCSANGIQEKDENGDSTTRSNDKQEENGGLESQDGGAETQAVT
jgi:RAB6-interacting golgin